MIQYKIVGLKELIDKATPDLVGKPLRKFFERASIGVQGKAREGAPVDVGQLRADIVYEVDPAEVPHWAKVGLLHAAPGSGLFKKATAMEYGTGLFAEGPHAKGGRHWPPGAALDVWAKRHGFASGWQVAAIIGKRGGLKPRRYLRNAFTNSQSEIAHWLQVLGQEIRERWDAK